MGVHILFIFLLALPVFLLLGTLACFIVTSRSAFKKEKNLSALYLRLESFAAAFVLGWVASSCSVFIQKTRMMVNPTYGQGYENDPSETLTGGFPIWFVHDDHGISVVNTLFTEDVLIYSRFLLNTAIWVLVSLSGIILLKKFVPSATTAQQTLSGSIYLVLILVTLIPFNLLTWILLLSNFW